MHNEPIAYITSHIITYLPSVQRQRTVCTFAYGECQFYFFISFHLVRMCSTRLIKCITLIGVLGPLQYCRTVESMNKTETQHNTTDKIRFYYYSSVFVKRQRKRERERKGSEKRREEEEGQK